MLKKWCEVTSCNGVIDLYECRANKKHLLFWTLIMVSSFGASVWFVYRTVVGFITTPTVTSVSTETETFLNLPEILLQYHGGLNVMRMKRANFSEELIHAFSEAFSFKTISHENLSELDNELKRYMKRMNLGYEGLAKHFGYSCEEMVKYISQPDDLGSLEKQRCENTELMITDRGIAYVFKNNSKQWYPGLWGGIQLMLKAPENSYVLVYPERALDLEMNHEYSITLENRMGPSMSKREYLIPLDAKVTVTLNTKRYIRVNDSRRCSSLESRYNSNTCFFGCWLRTVKECSGNCTPLNALGNGHGYYVDSNTCNPLFYDVRCINITNAKGCINKCLPLCDEWIYETTLAYSSLSNLNLNESLTQLFIGYNTMQYTKIEEVEAFTIDMAISNVGGQFGLWLGLSLVTIIQGLYYLILGICFKNETDTIYQCKQ